MSAPEESSSSTVPTIAQYVPALIVVDMQHDFVYGSLQVPGGASIIDPVNKLIDMPFTMRVATRDYHPDNHVSFAKTHQKSEFSKETIFHPEDSTKSLGVEQTLWPVHCVANTDGANFVTGLETSKFDAIMHKGTHPHIESYSAFRDIWCKGTTELPGLLNAQGVTDLYFVGLAGDYCVKYTALDAMDFGYNTWVIRDGIRSISDDDVAEKALLAKGVRFTTMQEVEKRLVAKVEADKERS
ncbi:hypothetical protein D9619_002636 [Psilocybe cf. subviscida]|uniref:nicotinamidase n=1 Tax=Psilocybe cf. subviscida TaxID=2480587 RepID=A0A8H5ETZ6_9AGAR|nr:hypothetical protein D9619_002636 [Psilocybe cf. subviscida]